MENLRRFEWWIRLMSHGVGHTVIKISRLYQWISVQAFFPCISCSLLPDPYPVAGSCSTWPLKAECPSDVAQGTSISEMSSTTLMGWRSTVLVKNVIWINGGAYNCSPVWSKKWLLNKRSLKLASCILRYFNCLMFLLYFWNSFHLAQWSNVNFYSRS